MHTANSYRTYLLSVAVRGVAAACLLAGLAVSGGCASTKGGRTEPDPPDETPPFPESHVPMPLVMPYVVGYDEYRDPLIRFNRAMFAFNDVTYRFVLIPLSAGYLRITPTPVRSGINNFFHNLRNPLFAVNHLLQGNPRAMGRNLTRFGVNSTVGVLGLFDPAKHWLDMPREETQFSATLSRYGVGYGVYLVLPFFGPSDVRDGVSTFVDYFLHPVPYILVEPVSTAVRTFDYFQEYAPPAKHYNTLRMKVDDPYIFFRNLYLQGIMRDAEY